MLTRREFNQISFSIRHCKEVYGDVIEIDKVLKLLELFTDPEPVTPTPKSDTVALKVYIDDLKAKQAQIEALKADKKSTTAIDLRNTSATRYDDLPC